MADFLFGPTLNNLQSVLDLRAQQHALTATNLANAETPGFHAREINFEKVLANAMDDRPGGGVRMAHARHIGHPTGNVQSPRIEESQPAPWVENDNSVVVDREMAKMAENSLLYGAITKSLSKRLQLLRFAASDGRG